MPQGDIESYHKDGKWLNRVEGEGNLTGEHHTRAQAVAAGRDEARERKVEHIIHNLDGTIGERSTYRHDPRNIPG